MWNDLNQIKQIKKEVFLVWKKLGNTPLEELDRVRLQLNFGPDVAMTYAGRLDPAAEGELLILTGEACKRKDEYLGLDKTYQFRVLGGFSTDTLDLLGLVNQVSNHRGSNHIGSNHISKDGLVIAMKNLIGTHKWPYPAYSARPVDGKPLWQWAREGLYSDLVAANKVPTNTFAVKYLELIDQSIITRDGLLGQIESLINDVSGNFRQEEIIARWVQLLNDKSDEEFILLSFKVKLTSGGYVRQLAKQLGDDLGMATTTYSIIRTKIHMSG